jgi:hypothetical protein
MEDTSYKGTAHPIGRAELPQAVAAGKAYSQLTKFAPLQRGILALRKEDAVALVPDQGELIDEIRRCFQ